MKRTLLLNSKDYVYCANVAYYKIVVEQKRFTGDTLPVYAVLAERTDEIAEVLKETAEDNLMIESKLPLGRQFVTLEQIVENKKPFDILEEAEKIIKNQK